MMQIRDALDHDAAGIAEIYNHAVLHTTAIWNEATVDAANRIDWMAARRAAGYPVLVAQAEDGGVTGYASYGAWRAFDGYRLTVEHSVYVGVAYRGLGLAHALMEALITRARAQGLHVMIAGIEAENTASLALHRKLGFSEGAVMAQVGQKFGRWLDLHFMSLQLDQRETPAAG